MAFPLKPEAEARRIKTSKEWWKKNRDTEAGKKRLLGIRKSAKSKKGKPSDVKGDKHPRWKGGQTIHEGYVYVKTDKKLHMWNGYVKRANLVWFDNTGEEIKPPYLLHHKNHDRQDDSFENLEKKTQSRHKKEEMKKQQRNVKGRFTSSQ